MWVGLAKLYFRGDAEAVNWFRSGIEATQNFALAHFLFGAALTWLGSLGEARTAMLRWRPRFWVHCGSTPHRWLSQRTRKVGESPPPTLRNLNRGEMLL